MAVIIEEINNEGVKNAEQFLEDEFKKKEAQDKNAEQEEP